MKQEAAITAIGAQREVGPARRTERAFFCTVSYLFGADAFTRADGRLLLRQAVSRPCRFGHAEISSTAARRLLRVLDEWPNPVSMTFDDQLQRYFGTTDMAQVPPDAVAAGLERMRVDFGLEKDRGYRFALWTVMYILGDAPDLDIAFKEEKDRNAARDFMDLMDSAPDM